MTPSRRAIILGGGVIGVATAYYLARHGHRVTLLERHREAGRETSFANGGLITPSMSDPWAAPGMPWKMVKWLGREDSPFLLRLRAVPGLLPWGWSFLRNCDSTAWRRNMAVIHELAEYSARCLDALTQETGIRYDQSKQGTLRLFRERASLEAARPTAEALAALGANYRVLDAAQCVEVEPTLAPEIDKLAGGIHFTDDYCGDAFKFTQELARFCAESGVEFRYGTTIEEIQTEGQAVTGIVTDGDRFEADVYIVALGSFSTAVMRRLRVKLPIYPVKGYSMTVSVKGWNKAPTMPIVDDGRKVGLVRLGDRLRIAGTAEFTGYDVEVNRQRCASLLESVRDLFPLLPNLDSAQPWAGLRPMTPNGIPIVSASPFSNLYLNVGHGHLGWTLACGSGRIISDLVAGRTPEVAAPGL